jgi:hypothetical protein
MIHTDGKQTIANAPLVVVKTAEKAENHEQHIAELQRLGRLRDLARAA